MPQGSDTENYEFDRRTGFIPYRYFGKVRHGCNRNAILFQKDSCNGNGFHRLVHRAGANGLQLYVLVFTHNAGNCTCYQIGV